MTACSEAIRRNPGLAIAYFDRRTAYHRRGDRAQAQADYEQAIRLDPALANFKKN